MICWEYWFSGTCSRGNQCMLLHYLGFCNICNVGFVDETSHHAHLRGERHQAQLFYFVTALSALHMQSWQCHQMFNPRIENARNNVESQAANTRYCHTCNTNVLDDRWADHLAWHRHRASQVFRHARGVFQGTSQNQCYVKVSRKKSGINFGTVRPTGGSVSTTVKISLTSPENIFLLDACLLSSFRGGIFSHFSTFSVVPWRGRLTTQEAQRIIVSFDPNGLFGKFTDRLQLSFLDGGLGQTFTISRDLVAISGNEGELKALAPIAPYVRWKRKIRRDPEVFVDGVKYDFKSHVRWAVKLPEFKVPEPIYQALAVRSLEDQVSRVGALLPDAWNSQTYTAFWSVLLHVEEVRMTQDLAIYDMEKEPLSEEHPYYRLTVPGLAEKRPSISLGDKIGVRKHGGANKWFIGYVHKIEQTSVLLRFNPKFESYKGQFHDVRFLLSRTSLRRMHHALSVERGLERLLYPREEHTASLSRPTELDISRLSFFNRLLKENFPQKLAVTSILRQPSGSVPFIVYGPPGTGKTVVVVEAIRQILHQDPGARLLVCAPSNSAADLLADRLRQQGSAASDMLRLNAPTRRVSTLSQTLRSFSRIGDDAFLVPSLGEMSRFRVVVSTCSSASLVYAIGVPRGHFSHIFVDEAGQALEPEVMIAIRTLAGDETNIILSGDPKQLGPIVRSAVASKLGSAVSYLDRLMRQDVYQLEYWGGITVVHLTQNFRNHASILQYPNDMFYNGRLQARADPIVTESLARWEMLVTPGFPVIFHSISGEDNREATSPSFLNPHEVLVVRDYIQALRENSRLKLTDEDIGVITPYNAQASRIRSVVNSTRLRRNRQGTIKVGCVEEFQGQERRVIIISTVRSNRNFVDINHAIGFVANPRRFNVAVTRAQALLILVGDPTVLSLDLIWRGFLNYIHASGGWRGLPRDWSDDQDEAGVRDFLRERRDDARDVIDNLAAQVEGLVIEQLPEGEHHEEDPLEATDDRPWREV
ncbi:P-loop containing nucleoside triphosphate hydrolase protein [Cantharellus anzutake]|uniref:P-loop containing nucleoside triphosphate hydrolase protein n=1 Tax=Cantharellus anzutake TaxID=1750568 RepID=UPI001903ECD7|nr:P-loop containing nucleoside triphosphate hydrolase protein [Cantharellus anzutake]KAF8325174.1 P-loop containing nucleoside triphosphate hydrolase protein [Cantharellus anzutake]